MSLESKKLETKYARTARKLAELRAKVKAEDDREYEVQSRLRSEAEAQNYINIKMAATATAGRLFFSAFYKTRNDYENFCREISRSQDAAKKKRLKAELNEKYISSIHDLHEQVLVRFNAIGEVYTK
jgi:hypothetical protein